MMKERIYVTLVQETWIDNDSIKGFERKGGLEISHGKSPRSCIYLNRRINSIQHESFMKLPKILNLSVSLLCF